MKNANHLYFFITPMKLTTCGNSCDVCRAFKENYEKFDEREALSAAWKKYLDLDISPKDIRCPGGPCCAVGLGLVHENCYYKECTAAHRVEHCGQCPDYPCPRFGEGRKISKQDLKEKLGDEFEIEEYEKYIKAFDHKTWVEKYRQSQENRRP